MNSILLCEGSTDYTLLQYYMRKAYRWKDERNRQESVFRLKGQKSRKLFCEKNILTIASAGGCSRLTEGLQQALKRNQLAPADSEDVFDHIVIITDRDEICTEDDFIRKVQKVFQEKNVCCEEDIHNNRWLRCEMKNNMGESLCFFFLLLVIPFEENGAMETFLLNAIAEKDLYDKGIIEKCSDFIDHIDPERRYLSGRRIVTKAKFDTYFSIRTSAEQFVERQNILKSVKWEEYTALQKDFKLLAVLSDTQEKPGHEI